MRRVVETDEGGFEALLGEKICLVCGIYIYTGRLVGVNADHLELEDPELVYETGEWCSGPWKDAQQLSSPWRVMLQGIESWGPAKC
jgi:hypothetical protein